MLADVGGQPLVVATWRRVREAGFSRVFVATDDTEIAAAVAAAGGAVLLTGDHPNGTARIAAALKGIAAEVVLNVQGDEPLVPVDSLLAIARALLDPEGAAYGIATGAAPLCPSEASSPARVKVVVGEGGRALAFSRGAVPLGGPYRVHVGVYAFRPATLQSVVRLPPSLTEGTESLEQLRWLEAGEPIRVVEVATGAPAVDTAADLEHVRAIFAARRAGNGEIG